MGAPGRFEQEEEEARGRNPAFILACLQELLASKAEFPIKVEGTHTLPYASELRSIEPDGSLVMKLIRPLPHELMPGALFEMLFSAGEQRYLGLVTFLKREAYLTYRFSRPESLRLSDRRRHKRFPFRPREMVDVLAQDAAVPSRGMTGPLVNLSQGGLAFRVDRIVKLDDGWRIPVASGFFDKGRPLPLLRIRNLPKVPNLDLRGSIAHVTEAQGQVLLGVGFGSLSAESESLLRMVLDLREKAFRASGASTSAEPRPKAPRRAGAAEPEPESAAEDPELAAPQALRALRRRTLGLAVVGGPESDRSRLLLQLRHAGFFRAEAYARVEDLEGLAVAPAPAREAHLLLLDPDAETLQEIRRTEQALQAMGRRPTLYFTVAPDPMAVLAEAGSWRLLDMPDGQDEAWLGVLDEVLEIADE